jgi:uncharacterized membrane protein YjgN (DUF898 family)
VAIPAFHGNSATQQMQPQLEQMQEMTPEQQQAEMQRQIDEITANAGIQANTSQTGAERYAEMAGIATFVITMIFYMLMGIYIQTRTTNLVLSSTSLDEHQLVSRLRVRNMFYIYLTNIIATIVSLGLLIPWCKIRLTRYRLKNLSLIVQDDINRFIANEQNNVKATAGEFADAFDLDMGF